MKLPSKIRQQLQVQERELSIRLNQIQQDRMRIANPLSADFSEQAIEKENDEVMDRLEQATIADLNQIRHALSRGADGLYGHCEQCGELIQASRLSAIPHATTCLRCAAGDGFSAPPSGKANARPVKQESRLR